MPVAISGRAGSQTTGLAHAQQEPIAVTIADTALKRTHSGEKIAFCCDVYGNNWVEFTSGLLIRRSQSIEVSRSEIEEIKAALRARSRRSGRRSRYSLTLRARLRRAFDRQPAI